MRFRELLAVLLCCVITLGFTGCAAKETELPGQSQAARTVTTQTPEPVAVVGLCMRQYEDSTAYYDALSASLSGAGYQVLTGDCNNDQAEQNRLVGEQLSQGCDLLIVEPVMTEAMENVVEQAKKANIPLLILDREPNGLLLDSYEKLSFVGWDSTLPGTLQAQLTGSLPEGGDLNGDGILSYILLSGPEDDLDAQLRRDNANLALESTGTSELLDTRYCDWTQDSGRAMCASLLADYGKDIEVILCANEQIAQGAVEAIAASGWTAGLDVHVLAIGMDANLEALIASGTVSGTVHVPTDARIRCVVETAAKLLSGEPTEKTVYTDWASVTAEITAE